MTTSSFLSIFMSLRPLQWLKNLSIFSAILFSGRLFNPNYLWPVFFAFLIFNLLSSGMYLINDLIDVERDKVHTYKRFRTIDQGLVSKKLGLLLAVTLIIIGLYFSFKLSTNLF